MLLNKVLLVSLLVLGLCFLQPALGDQRLAKRINGGTQANAGQFPFVVLIRYLYNDVNGNSVTYQGTGIVYNPTTVVTSATAMSQCADGTVATLFQGVADTSNQAGATIISFTCMLGSTIVVPNTHTAGNFFNDIAYIDVTSTAQTFPAGTYARLPTSSPTPADDGSLFAIGYGEIVPGGTPSPVLIYVPLNLQLTHVCVDRLSSDGLAGNVSFAENFCLSGFIKSPTTGFLTDACTLDAGGPIIRTKNIGAPTDHEVVGIINFSSCTDSTPTIATYLWKYEALLPTAGNPANATASGNPRAFDGNFACGDGTLQTPFEQCDVGVYSTDITQCCNPYTCKFRRPNTPCTSNNNGTICQSRLRCNRSGVCTQPSRFQGKNCNGLKTRCMNGQCIKDPNQ